MSTTHERAVRAAFARYIQLFNERDFFEAHEVLEEVWLEDETPDRLFLQGLIQVAASLHHLHRGKLRAARKTLARAELKFRHYPAVHWDLNIARLVDETGRAIAEHGPAVRIEPPEPEAIRVPRICIEGTDKQQGGESAESGH